MTDPKPATRLTILLPAGRLPLPIMAKATELAQRHNLEVYLSTAQNLRLMGIDEADLPAVKAELAALGAAFKGPGKFPLPRVCIGRRDCSTGMQDPQALSALIFERFAGTPVKPKFKIAISGCPLGCPGVMTTDIGLLGTRKGWDLHVGGKGGPHPRSGRRVLREASDEQVLAAIATLVSYHYAKTGKKQRLAKLVDEPDFPFPAEA
ncbi:MAG: nitrite reductase [Thermodesulfobacteriota bacterium]